MREWIITNGLGGFSSSTDIGINARRYHGLLIAPINPPGLRKLILSKVDESIEIGDKKYNLYVNSINEGEEEKSKYLQKFEKTIIPIFTYKVKNVIIEKSICMIYGKNTVAVNYRISNQKEKAKLLLTPLVNFRDFHAQTREMEFNYLQTINNGKLQLEFGNGNQKINIYVKNSKYKQYEDNIFYSMYYEKEKERGFDAYENHAIPGTFEVEIKPNEDKEITFLCSLEGKYGNTLEELEKLEGSIIIENEIKRIDKQIKESKLLECLPKQDEEKQSYIDLVNKYIIASDNFIVYRPNLKLHTLIAGYPWFLDWGRDSLIAFEGLLLLPKRYKIAEEVLLTFIINVKQGIVPNGFDEYDGHCLYNSADSSLLLFEQVQKYLKYTKNYKFVKENLYEKMKEIVKCYLEGTNIDSNNIYLDKEDYLIVSGTIDTQNTWMDAKVNGIPATPRNGKVVEINALWYNSLKIMQNLAKKFEDKESENEYKILSKKCQVSFEKLFYNENKKSLYDVIGDAKVRPNQLFAISTTYPVLKNNKEISKKIFITVTQKLLNKYGLKTLAEGEEGFEAIYEGSPLKRDSIYHQGPTWTWLLGPYYDAFNNIIAIEKDKENKEKLRRNLMQFKVNIAKTFTKEMIKGNTIGSICEIYDSTNTSTGKGAFAQAWSVSEVFRILLG